MRTICHGGTERNISYVIYEEYGDYIATIDNHKEHLTETFPQLTAAKKWVNRILDICWSEQNEIDRFT